MVARLRGTTHKYLMRTVTKHLRGRRPFGTSLSVHPSIRRSVRLSALLVSMLSQLGHINNERVHSSLGLSLGPSLLISAVQCSPPGHPVRLHSGIMYPPSSRLPRKFSIFAKQFPLHSSPVIHSAAAVSLYLCTLRPTLPTNPATFAADRESADRRFNWTANVRRYTILVQRSERAFAGEKWVFRDGNVDFYSFLSFYF